jgi:phosphatidylserine/phosphatidylglycerophosphate/cardiolipin synthase-like enzyme
LSEPDVVARLEQLGPRLRIIIDDDGPHGEPGSGETRAAARLAASAGAGNVKRQHMGKLQHNKTIAVDGPKVQAALCGSTNYTWRGFFVQSNNAVVLRGASAVRPFMAAFDHYWQHDSPAGFGTTGSAKWNDLGLEGIDAQVGFSPFAEENAMLGKIADDIAGGTTSSLFFSLAFLAQTPGPVQDALEKVINTDGLFVYGIADRAVKGIELSKPDGNPAPVHPDALGKDAPEPFRSEPTGGGGNRLHHKFLVIDFDRPTARVYLGSYNFSAAADRSNGENLLILRDRRVAVSFMVEAVRIFDHYHFRVVQEEAKNAKRQLGLARPPRGPGEKPWWSEYFTVPRKIRDRELFA